jgi:sortase (surface protein transpeptidase)
MAERWRRWRAPLLGGIAVWLMSVPLLMGHPVAATSIKSAEPVAAVQITDHVLLRRLARSQAATAGTARTIGTLAAPQGTTTAATAARGVTAALSAPPQRPAPAVHANDIVIPRLGLNQPVGWYSDCLGRAPVPRWGAWRWSCAGANNIYVMAHNPGVFTPILGLRAGDIIEYGDPSGRIHTYRVSYTTIVSNTQLWPLSATGVSSLTLQTCWTWDGTRDFIVRAVEI